ncbi:helix-turn-helix transcriptional regulator [Latilactobacillus graminis]|uniref:helix-turn-helix transcriptional regulator n=1 Tax=Latilactobacillus graminis TaxID=60519 RepID=UPI00070DF2AF|nr:AraC family transcriptional regulator [Latilactobacillus graminis]
MKEIDIRKLVFANQQVIPSMLANLAKIGDAILYIVDIEGHLVTEVYGSLEVEPAMLIDDDVSEDLTLSGIQRHDYQLEHASLPLKIKQFNMIVGYICCARYIDKRRSNQVGYRRVATEHLEETSELVQSLVEHLLRLNILELGQEQVIFNVQESQPVKKPHEKLTAIEMMAKLRQINATNDMIIKAIQFIDENIERPLTLDKVAAHIYLSPYYFSKLFRKETGFSFSTYLSVRKMQKATKLLANKKLTVKEVAVRLNYPQVSYFSQIFKKYINCTPSEYRKRINS